jgi:hypothetical protein
MKVYREVKVKLHSFLIFSPGGREGRQSGPRSQSGLDSQNKYSALAIL